MIQEFNVFTRAEQHFVTEEVLSANTEFMNAKLNNSDGVSTKKWNYHSRTIADEASPFDHPMMCLRLVQRNNDEEGYPVSPLWDFFEPIFHRARTKMNLPYEHTLRSSINLTWYSPDMHGVVHKDHYSIPHYNMVLILSPISQGGTFICDEDKNIVDESSPNIWSATAFTGLWHAQGFCAPNETRAVMVVTWV